MISFRGLDGKDKDLIVVSITSLDVISKSLSRPEKEIIVEIFLKQKPTTDLMTTFIPTLLLILITFSGTCLS